jgi:hypothetical protein
MNGILAGPLPKVLHLSLPVIFASAFAGLSFHERGFRLASKVIRVS